MTGLLSTKSPLLVDDAVASLNAIVQNAMDQAIHRGF
jgi:hypothetical protein